MVELLIGLAIFFSPVAVLFIVGWLFIVWAVPRR